MVMRYTPEHIVTLGPKEIFVFGSNAQGNHHGGAARIAHERFGAILGIGEGLQGQSYALPTMEGPASFKRSAERFIEYATEHPELTFYLTRVGTGIAGHTNEEVAPLFREAPSNVIKPKGWQ